MLCKLLETVTLDKGMIALPTWFADAGVVQQHEAHNAEVNCLAFNPYSEYILATDKTVSSQPWALLLIAYVSRLLGITKPDVFLSASTAVMQEIHVLSEWHSTSLWPVFDVSL